MEQVTRYKAVDGIIYDTEEDCAKHERDLKERKEKIYVFYKDKNGNYGKFDVPNMNGNDKLFLETQTQYIYVPNSKTANALNDRRFCCGVDFCGDVLYKYERAQYEGLCLKPYIQYLNTTIRNYTNDLNMFENFSSMANYYCAYTNLK